MRVDGSREPKQVEMALQEKMFDAGLLDLTWPKGTA